MDGSQPSCAPFLPAAQGAVLKDLDLVRWLEKKLADRERWAGRTCASFVSREMVEELMTCFSSVDHTTKMKVVLSFLYLPPRHSKQWKESLSGLLNIARIDPDDWVEVISDLLRDVPMAGGTKSMATDDLISYRKMIDELAQCATSHEKAGNLRTDPPSFDACSQMVVKNLLGYDPPPIKHFNLKKKPKSYSLQMEIKKQCEHLVSSKKERKEAIVAGSLPIRIRSTRREGNNDLPMKGIPTMNTVKMSQGFSNEPKKFQRTLSKREGGAKLIDIGELPLPFKQRRMAEAEDERRKAREEKEQQKQKAAEERKAAAEAKRLAILKVKEEARIAAEKKMNQNMNASKNVQAGQVGQDHKNGAAKRRPSQAQSHEQLSPLRPPMLSPTRIQPHLGVPLHSPGAHQVPVQQQHLLMQQHQQGPPIDSHIQDPPRTQQMHAPVRQQMQPVRQQMMSTQQQNLHQPQQQQHVGHQMHHPQQQMQQPMVNMLGSPPQQQPGYNVQRHVIVRNFPGQMNVQLPGSSGVQMAPQQAQASTPQQQMPSQQYVVSGMQQPQGYADFQDLDVARKCHEILSTANALEEKGRTLVLQFMKGGLRCDTTPNMDHIMTLKLSENIEDGLVDGRLQKLKVEVFFQMDLSNGEWKRLRKCRMLEGDELNAMMGHPPAQAWNNQQFNQQNFQRH